MLIGTLAPTVYSILNTRRHCITPGTRQPITRQIVKARVQTPIPNNRRLTHQWLQGIGGNILGLAA